MDPTQCRPNPTSSGLKTPIRNYLRDRDSGRYRSNIEPVLMRWAYWAESERQLSTITDVGIQDCRTYARALRDASREREHFAPESARRYYGYVSALLGWAVDEALLETHPATKNSAQDPLPTDETETDRQYWTERDRSAITTAAQSWVDAAADGAHSRERAYRDRAVVYTLAYSGARSAELFSVSGDERRAGLRWGHVDLDSGTIEVFGKSRDWEGAPLLDPALTPLRQWRDLTAAEDDAAVFPRLDNAAKGVDPTPSITTQAARDILTDLCEWSDYDLEDHLKPHGARRGLGRSLYRENPQLAQDILRHQSIEITHESYAEEATRRTRDLANEIIDE